MGPPLIHVHIITWMRVSRTEAPGLQGSACCRPSHSPQWISPRPVMAHALMAEACYHVADVPCVMRQCGPSRHSDCPPGLKHLETDGSARRSTCRMERATPQLGEAENEPCQGHVTYLVDGVCALQHQHQRPAVAGSAPARIRNELLKPFRGNLLYMAGKCFQGEGLLLRWGGRENKNRCATAKQWGKLTIRCRASSSPRTCGWVSCGLHGTACPSCISHMAFCDDST